MIRIPLDQEMECLLENFLLLLASFLPIVVFVYCLLHCAVTAYFISLPVGAAVHGSYITHLQDVQSFFVTQSRYWWLSKLARSCNAGYILACSSQADSPLPPKIKPFGAHARGIRLPLKAL